MSALEKITGVDFQAIWMTMLALVGLYLVLRNPGAVTSIVREGGGFVNRGLFILQGRTPPRGF